MEKQEILKDDGEILIFADNREFRSNVVKEMARKDCTVKPKQLEVGDYILSDRVAVERKSCNDFLSSVFHGNIFDQLEELKRNFEKPLLMIEGEDLYCQRDVHPNSIRGAIASIGIDLSVPIIWTDSEEDTASFLHWIAKREQKEEERTVSLRGEKKPSTLKEQQLFLLAGLPDIDKKMSKRLLKKFKKPEAVFTASKEELKEVRGIGEKRAEKLRKALTKEISDD
ncbi:MAG: ERCC4 domain-containing protein [Candidatus Aenigmatarchaeota archaeon]